jgi:MFS family permease
MLTHRQIMVVFSGLMSGSLIAALDQNIVATALPHMVSDLGGLSHISWVVTAYLLTTTISTPLYGKLGDLFGRKRLFQIAIVIFVLGSMLSGAAQSMTQLIAFRGVQGLGAGGIIVGAQAIIGDLLAPAERGRYQGYTGSVGAGEHRRSVHRRLLHRAPVVALGVLHQCADRCGRAHRDVGGAAAAGA